MASGMTWNTTNGMHVCRCRGGEGTGREGTGGTTAREFVE